MALIIGVLCNAKIIAIAVFLFFLLPVKIFLSISYGSLPREHVTNTALISMDTLENVCVKNIPLMPNVMRENMTWHVF